ncbi:MAG: hypothetical protein NTZ79_15360, partial [Proteobacteria bacterium]|nr:hypothetical protein [Pseudomonadota bacterium]
GDVFVLGALLLILGLVVLFVAWPVGAIALVESMGGSAGARYQPLVLWDAPSTATEFHVF